MISSPKYDNYEGKLIFSDLLNLNIVFLNKRDGPKITE